jgi:hypothetical protein
VNTNLHTLTTETEGDGFMDLNTTTPEAGQTEPDTASDVPGSELLPTLPARYTMGLPTIVFDADDRWLWALARAERLLPEVVDMLGQHLTIPSDLRITLVGRWRLAREYGARTAEETAGYIGTRYRSLLIPHTIKALLVDDFAVWANDVGRVDTFVNVRRAYDGDKEFGATLTSAVAMATLMSSYSRASHLRQWRYPTSRPRYDVSEHAVLDVRLALLDAEEEAADAAAAQWRERFDWLPPAIGRAHGLVQALDRAEHVTTWQEQAVDDAMAARHTYYSGERVPQDVEEGAIWALREWVKDHGGAEATGEGEQLAADRRTRLAASAFTDYRALERLIEDGEPFKYMDKLADELGKYLYEFDVAHGTGRGGCPVDDPYWSATRNWRGYARQEWLTEYLAPQPESGTVPAVEPEQVRAEELHAGLTEPCEPAENTAAWTLRLYDQLHPVTDVSKKGVWMLLGWISTHATDIAADGEDLAAERASRLRAAAHADELALRAELHPTDHDDPELANDAIALGWHLRDFDARWGTGENVVPRPRDLSWETRSARDYTRAAWGAAHHEQRDEK